MANSTKSSASDCDTKDKLDSLKVKKKSKCCKCMFWTVSILVGLASCFVGFVYYMTKDVSIPFDIAEQLGPDGVQVFLAYDRNRDGYLSPLEFEPLFHRFAVRGQPGSPNGEDSLVSYEPEYDIPIEEDDEVVTVEAHFQPLLIETMTREKDKDPLNLGFGLTSTDVLSGLKKWKKPSVPTKNFGVRHFSAFFRQSLIHGPVGVVDFMISDAYGLVNAFAPDTSSNRFFPPFVTDDGVILHRLLSMFHPHPFIMTRFGPRGTAFVVRARNDKFIDIMFRIHAEYQLNTPPDNPFWFTPGQFTGNIIVSWDLKHIEHFNMYVPATKKLNVDMEWLESGKNMVVDIGYMPEMNLTITSPSVPATGYQDGEIVPIQSANMANIVWKEEISHEEARRRLEVNMYKFKEVPYYNFTDALMQAQKENRLVHSIVLWGALDDQSC